MDHGNAQPSLEPLVPRDRSHPSAIIEFDQASAAYSALASMDTAASQRTIATEDISAEDVLSPACLSAEALLLLTSSLPIVLSTMSQLLIMIPLMAAVGALGTVALASMNLVSVYAGLAGIAPLLGLPMALDSLCSQAYTAAADRRLLGVYLQRALVVGLLFEAALYPLWWNSQHIYQWLGVPPAIAATTAAILKLYFFAIALMISYECLRSYLFAQGIRRFAVIAQAVCLPLGWFTIWLLLSNPSTSLGILGVPWVIISAALCLNLVTLVFVAKVDGSQCWGGWSRAAFSDFRAIVKLALAGSAVAFFESVALHMIDLGVLFMDAPTMAAQAILSMLLSSVYVIGTGFAIAACNRVGNLLGRAHPNRALLAVYTTVGISSTMFLLIASVILWYRHSLPRIFSPDPEVVDILIAHIPWTAVACAIQGVNMGFSGILRGQRRQSLIARIRVLSFVCVGFPMGAVGVLVLKWGLAGLWLGYLTGVLTILAAQVYTVATTDWDKEIERCQRCISDTAYSTPPDTYDAGDQQTSGTATPLLRE
ncbi:hypothetical protein LPJ53_001652 [Coemansia erecta]|uniref:MATE efflux family protein n=1 Tax=Coemansia erecta TaxID=147472 RepID=A0A9W8CRW8_9FUNG|nr:hypothetical protein LPJ53_001652 [Coemansia erecta]